MLVVGGKEVIKRPNGNAKSLLDQMHEAVRQLLHSVMILCQRLPEARQREFLRPLVRPAQSPVRFAKVLVRSAVAVVLAIGMSLRVLPDNR